MIHPQKRPTRRSTSVSSATSALRIIVTVPYPRHHWLTHRQRSVSSSHPPPLIKPPALLLLRPKFVSYSIRLSECSTAIEGLSRNRVRLLRKWTHERKGLKSISALSRHTLSAATSHQTVTHPECQNTRNRERVG